jgi:hypothetical protein
MVYDNKSWDVRIHIYVLVDMLESCPQSVYSQELQFCRELRPI